MTELFKEKFMNIFSNLLDFAIENLVILLVSFGVILFFVLLLFLIKFILKRFKIKNKKLQVWLILLFNFLTFSFLRRFNKNEELNKINMLLYDSLDESLDKDKDYKETKESVLKDRFNIPDSPLKKKEEPDLGDDDVKLP